VFPFKFFCNYEKIPHQLLILRGHEIAYGRRKTK